MDAVTRQADRGGKHDLPGNHSHVVRPAEMEWKKTRFPGCEVKGLLLDRQTGLVTALMRLAPGAVLPDSTEHVKIEHGDLHAQKATLLIRRGPVAGLSVGPGEFVWREAGTRHVALDAGGRALCWRVLRAQQVSFPKRTAPSPTYPAPTGTAFGATCLRIRWLPTNSLADLVAIICAGTDQSRHYLALMRWRAAWH